MIYSSNLSIKCADFTSVVHCYQLTRTSVSMQRDLTKLATVAGRPCPSLPLQPNQYPLCLMTSHITRSAYNQTSDKTNSVTLIGKLTDLAP